MFENEKHHMEKGRLLWIHSFYGYSVNSLIESLNLQDHQYIHIDLRKDLYTFDHFYRFSLVKIFMRFINTTKQINTVGQLYKFLDSVSFDSRILSLLKNLNNDELTRRSGFLISIDILMLLCEKLGVRYIFISDFQNFWEDRKNSVKDFSEAGNYLVNSVRKYIRTYEAWACFELKGKNNSDVFIEEQDRTIQVDLSDYSDKDGFFTGEVEWIIRCDDYEKIKDSIERDYIEYISKARGGNQLKYFMYLLALAGGRGLTVSELAGYAQISAGAAGSSLKRLSDISLIRKNGNRYLVKNTAYRQLILEINR